MQGGSRDHRFVDDAEGHALGQALRLSWRQKATDGFFLRAETFHDQGVRVLAPIKGSESLLRSRGQSPCSIKGSECLLDQWVRSRGQSPYSVKDSGWIGSKDSDPLIAGSGARTLTPSSDRWIGSKDSDPLIGPL